MPVILVCAYEPCSIRFPVPPSISKITRFCSRQCRLLDEQVTDTPARIARRFWPKVNKLGPDDCWLWQASLNKGGYGQFQVRENRKLLHDGAHIASFFLHHGRWPAPGMQALHTCDVRHCVNPAHLWEGTQVDNMQDCVAKGRNGNVTHPERLARGDRSGLRLHRDRAPRGERNTNAKLTDAQWEEALALWQSGDWTQTALGKRYGVSQHAILSRLKHLL